MITNLLAFASIAWFGWLLCVWLSPLSITADRQPVPRWRLTPVLQQAIEDAGIKLYVSDSIEGYALSCYLGFQPAIVLNGPFMRHALDQAKDFTAAHELAHHINGDVMLRLLCVAFFRIDKLPYVRRKLALTEHIANEDATRWTGHSPSVVWGPITAGEILQRRGTPTEEER